MIKSKIGMIKRWFQGQTKVIASPDSHSIMHYLIEYVNFSFDSEPSKHRPPCNTSYNGQKSKDKKKTD